ncbi:hypothetical protein VHEMI05618 [[Torrubiella] hemipterigena]|uniref:Uncharacterized protein n=1 Tax=[Torrubiella] hemipterigena TaxID=1531966 RepID=A0A0A1THH8_9HYPO|nr:hypothetical protein VHEMI05618 [[Torrubiella] hemipterigena]
MAITMVSFLRRPLYCLIAAFILTTLSMLQYYSTLPTENILEVAESQVYSKCDFSNVTEIDDRWNQLATKYLHFRDDKFTYVQPSLCSSGLAYPLTRLEIE